MSNQRLQFICIGAGAIGTYLGGKLILGGHDVVFVETDDGAKRLIDNGLSIVDTHQEQSIHPVKAFSKISGALEWQGYDHAIIALKAYDTAGLIRTLADYTGDMPSIISFQNGVDNEGLFSAAFGANKVIAGTVTTAVKRIDVGQVRVERERGVGIGEHPRSLDLVRAFCSAGLKTKYYRHPLEMKWSKLLTNLIANASSAILGIPPGEIFADLDLFRLEMQQIDEAVAVMRKLGLRVTDLPGTPVRALAWFATSVPPRISQAVVKPVLSRGRGEKMPSLAIDLSQGKKNSEVGYLNGAVARYGKMVGVETPINTLLFNLLIQMIDNPDMQMQFQNNPKRLLSLV